MKIANLASALLQSSLPGQNGQAKPSSGFAEMLHTEKAPPGPEPPPGKSDHNGEKEQKTVEPNAQSKKPDLSSTKRSTAQSTTDAAKPKDQEPIDPRMLPAALLPLIGSVKGIPISAVKQPSSQNVMPIETSCGLPQEQVSLAQLPQDANSLIVGATVNVGAAAVPYDGNAPPSDGALPVIAPVQQQISNAAVAEITDPVVAEPAARQVSAFIPEADKLQPQHNSLPQTPLSPPSTLAQMAGSAAGNPQTGSQAGQHRGQPESETDPAAAIQIAKAVSSHVDKLAAIRSAENVTVHLQGEDNSSVVLTVKATHGQVQAQIVTDNGTLKNALQHNRSQLATTLQSKGMSLGDVSVGLKNSSGDRQQAQQALRQLVASGAVPTRSSTSPAYGFRKARGVDLTV